MLMPALYRVAYLGFMFLANLLLANILEPAGLGKLSLMILNASLVSLITGIGSDSMAMHALVQNKWNYSYGISFLGKMTFVQLGLFSSFQILSWLLLQQTLLSAGSIEMIGVEFVYFSGLIITEKCLTAFYVLHRSKLYNLLLFIIGAIYLLVLAVCWILKIRWTGQTYFWLIAVHSLFQSLALIIVLIRIQGSIKWTQVHWQQALKIVKTAALIMFTNVVQLLAYRIDYWLLNFYQTTFEVGMYAQANKFASLLWLLPNILAAMLIPKFKGMQQEELMTLFRLAFVMNVAMTFATIVATIIFYNYFLVPQYQVGIEAFWLMLPGYFCWAWVIFFGAYFSWTGAFKINFFASTFCLILILIMDLILIPLHSYNGTAIANTITYLSVLLLYIFIYGRKNGNHIGLLPLVRKSDIAFIKRVLK